MTKKQQLYAELDTRESAPPTLLLALAKAVAYPHSTRLRDNLCLAADMFQSVWGIKDRGIDD